MPDAFEKVCRKCRYTFTFPAERGTFECPACGTVNGRPKAEGADYEPLRRATVQRLGCDFENAVNSYQHILLDYPDEHEALWGLVLCRYGVEYVEDPRTGKRLPTVHSVRAKPMQTDNDFLEACRHAPEEVRAQYEAEAQYIDDAMSRIRTLAEEQAPYDVFICHKTTVPGSENLTPEYGRAAEMAHQLEKLGYRVFFAPESIKGEAGADYEAAIYRAVDTAKVMLLFCANPEYVSSPWVRSEWTRFHEMTLGRTDKRLVPLLYGGFMSGMLPRELRPCRLECVTMDSFTAASDVLGLLERFCRKPVPEKGAAKEKTAPVASVEQEKSAPAEEKPAPAKAVAEKKPAPVYASEKYFATKAVAGGCGITRYKGKGGVVNVPPTIGGCKVVEIGENAFECCGSLTSITLPAGVTRVGYKAFKGCGSLTSVTLPAGLTSIGMCSFAGCSSLTSITLPAGLTSIEKWTFDGCSSLTSITLPAGLTSIGMWSFAGCSSLTSITLPEGVTSIGALAFSGCRSLTNVDFPESGCDIGGHAFRNCYKLRSSVRYWLDRQGAM